MMYIINYVVVTRPTAGPPAVPVTSVPAPISAPKMPTPSASVNAPAQVNYTNVINDYNNFEMEPVTGTEALTYEDYDAYGLGMYFDPLGMLMGLCSNLLFLIIFAIIVNILLFWGILLLISFFKKKECICPKCNKVNQYKGKKPLRCKFCGTKLIEKLEGH